jgi:predicted lipoprotein with Yx(FWY)xxD motif
MDKRCICCVALAALSLAACAVPEAFSDRNGNLTSSDGRTLYVFGKDSPGKSNCNGACASQWPPFIARDGARTVGAFTVITREDGARQWAHSGQPLYFYAADVQPGDAKGEGQGGAWSVVKVPVATTMPARANDGGY